MVKKDNKLPLPTLDDLFTTQKERDEAMLEKVHDIELNDLQEFPKHPFKVTVNEEMQNMVDSIKEYGVLVPAIVRPLDNGKYQIISGHRRRKASELANIKTLPCIVRDLTDDEATIIMVDSNLQREHILPSEKAFAYKMKLEAMKRQGKRTDLDVTSHQVGGKLSESAFTIGKENGDSLTQVRRYIRLTELIKPLLDMVDEKVIALSPAVEISYLTKEQQKSLLESIELNVATPSLSQAQELKRLSQAGKLDEDTIDDIMSKEKPNQVEKIRLDIGRLKTKIPKSVPITEYAGFIDKALEFYTKHLEKQKSANVR